MTADEITQALYAFYTTGMTNSSSVSNKDSKACDLVYKEFDALYWDNKFSVVDDVIKNADLDRLSICSILVMMTYTHCAKDKLAERRHFVVRARANMLARLKDEARVARLTDNLMDDAE